MESTKIDGRSTNGKPKNAPNRLYYKWEVMIFDKDKNEFSSGKFSTITELNEKMDLKLNNDLAYRLHSRYRCDETGRNKENSFVKRWGHIKLKKIKEFREKE